MLASTRPNQGKRERRGVVLILILGVLALMAIIGVTFATFSGQSRISARNFAQSLNRPLQGELMDFALSQLVGDTSDIRSAIRGHSLARDMYGNDAANNGYLTSRPGGAGTTAPYNYSQFYIVKVQPVGTSNPILIDMQTNLALNDSALYGYNFTRWVLRLGYVGPVPAGTPKPVDQTFEVVFDDYANALGSAVADGTHRVLRVSPVDSQTYLNNPTLAALYSNVNWSNGTNTAVQPPSSNLNFPFILDGRYLRAFNGPGMAQNAVYGNFKYNGLLLGQTLPVGDPNVVGMDEDYDAVDLENWFLAMQSADGTVIIPSFHRPGILRYDYTNLLSPGVPTSDWNVFAADSPSRILRPRGADHPAFATSFPDPVPGTSGTIKYDVDNDGDGETDSVWVDLGYPTRTDERGQLFKPLFAFMVIGLNGRIPLNTAGNIAGGRGSNPSTHASHLGNSPSEIDPTYALQNAFDALGLTYSQTDNAGVDVRLTQLRNLLTGTRPNPSPNQQNQGLNPNPPFGELNWVYLDGMQYYMPNGQFDATPPVAPPDVANGADPFGNPAAVRNTQPVSGRWGEADLVPGFILPPATPPPTYTSRSRAGLSRGYTFGATGFPRDADDDNLNVFDPYPLRNPNAAPPQLGEVMDQDLYDASGGLILPVERNRRFVTPMDINGTGQIVNFQGGSPVSGAANRGGDQWGRVAHYSYFRPPGLPGIIDTNPTSTTVGAIGYIPGVTQLYRNSGDPAVDTTNNLTHAFDFFRFPTASPVRLGGMPFDLPTGTPTGTTIPTYDLQVAGKPPPSDGLDEADEMNLYLPTSIDDPFGMGDLEWLYRKQDIDGAQLSSRLATLAPISFADKSLPAGQGHGIRHRRLFSTDTWETNSASWANDNPGGTFPANSRFLPLANADLANVNVTTANITGNPTYPWAQFSGGVVPTNTTSPLTPDPVPGWPVPAPSIAHRDRRINLNFPLPVSNDPNEPVRQKWINEAYQLLKAVLPPKSIDTPEELAQLSQFLVNVVDFRDPDAAMTHFRNPDVNISFTGTAPTLAFATIAAPANLDQYGMEYNPIALNEVLLYSYVSLQGGAGAAETGRFYVELLNTLTASATPNTNPYPTAPLPGWPFNTSSTLDLGGFSYTANDPYNGGSWDLVFTADSATSRPDPYTGQLNPTGAGLYYGLIPLNKDGFGAANGNLNAVDVKANPLATAGLPTLPTTQTSPVPTTYPYVLGSPPVTGYDLQPPSTTVNPPTLVQSLDKTFDPVGATSPTTFTFRQGVLPGITSVNPTTNYPPPGTSFAWKLPLPVMQTGTGTIKGPGTITFYWVCLRRPADPFQPVSATNPMVVVDAMRVPYIDGTGLITTSGTPPPDLTKANDIYSVRRWQPYRGGQAVPPGIGTALIDPHYGYTEQIVPPATGTTPVTQGIYDSSKTPPVPATNLIYHSLGSVATGAGTENWDYLPFHDRDFTSVAELMLVPGCPPGLFTKQFVENVPTATFATPTPLPTVVTALPLKVTVATPPTPPSSNALATNLHTYPYLSDKFFYTAVSDATVAAQTVDGYTSAGWHKMFEFFEVPTQANGSIGPIAHGANFDWQRQDLRPGLLNLNLIMDEEVFLSLLGSHDNSFNELYLNTQVVTAPQPPAVPLSPLQLPRVVTGVDAHGTPLLPAAGVPSGSYEYQWNAGYINSSWSAPASPAVKAAFAQFLKVRHGGSGFLFAWGSGATGTPDPAYTPPQLAVAAERPFRSLSFPDIDYTVMRPAALPPSLYSFPVLNTTPGPGYANDPGWKNNNLFPGYLTATLPTILVPPPIPTRRLFQIPDSNTASNASESGDPYVNVQTTTTATPPPPPPYTTGSMGTLSNNNVNLVSPILIGTAPATYIPYLGNAVSSPAGAGDNSQNPYFRSEMLQRVMNLTTVRTHQYAVWITVGFFRVTRQGDPSQGFGNQAFDQLGAEVGLPGGKQVRYRAFFVVDRTKLAGFDPSSPGNYRDAIVYRQTIQ